MNKDLDTIKKEKVVKDFLTHNAIEAKENKWFTHRTLHRLPPRQATHGRTIMAVVTIIAIIAYGIILRYATLHFPIEGENNITVTLLCIYTAIMSTAILIALQVIRFIKTYF